MVRNSIINHSILSKVKPRQLVLLGMTASLLAASVLVSQVRNSHVLQKEKQAQQVVAPEIKTVTALGRLEPRGEVIKLSAPTASGQGSRLEKLLVEDWSLD